MTARELLRSRSCYDILPDSYKLIVLETTLRVSKGLAALLQHGVQSAPVWDATSQRFVGMFTAAKVILANGLHRLPLVDRSEDTEAIVSVVTQFHILRYIANNANGLPGLDSSLYSIPLGTYNGIQTITSDTPLVEVLNLFVSRRISAVPIVNSEGVVLDVYEKYDVLLLAKDSAYFDLNMPVSAALALRAAEFDGVHTCTTTDTVAQVLDSMRRMTVHRLVMVDEAGRLVGIVSLSDVLRFLVEPRDSTGV
ncbi:AMP-activated serine/threonine-protein kinase regulatory subunit [Cladochytrium tenue]|nr:AMP-activated serine/threonine-protein kinase regulatory subunit [Cladochytrium tenue]